MSKSMMVDLDVVRQHPHAAPLEYLAGVELTKGPNATWKQLAFIAHRMNMTKEERQKWYRTANSIPLTKEAAGIIIARLNERDAMFEELQIMLHDN